MEEKKSKTGFALSQKNYRFILIGIALIIFGFILMTGGRSNDPQVFNETMFSARRIIVAPIIVLAGFFFEIYAIMHKPKEE
ncbi:MAG: DUF3098 domain-containing protein [Salinivirgaceae bacterium]|nr:DUF3098 domain-containing protein [Salinivirgaceae bacterium]